MLMEEFSFEGLKNAADTLKTFGTETLQGAAAVIQDAGSLDRVKNAIVDLEKLQNEVDGADGLRAACEMFKTEVNMTAQYLLQDIKAEVAALGWPDEDHEFEQTILRKVRLRDTVALRLSDRAVQVLRARESARVAEKMYHQLCITQQTADAAKSQRDWWKSKCQILVTGVTAQLADKDAAIAKLTEYIQSLDD
jgi:hypothetical protein